MLLNLGKQRPSDTFVCVIWGGGILSFEAVLCFVFCIADECQTKYGNANAWRYCCKVFDLLTVAAVSSEPHRG